MKREKRQSCLRGTGLARAAVWILLVAGPWAPVGDAPGSAYAANPPNSFNLEWFALDAGTASSGGGAFAVTALIGEPDPGVVVGGPYTLVGAIGVLRGPAAPRLSIERSEAGLVVTWPNPAVGWVLQETASLASAQIQWTVVAPGLYQTIGNETAVTLPTPVGTRFYRLVQP